MSARRNCVARLGDTEVLGVDLGHCVAFKGIPYAEPPVGPLRWAAPRPKRLPPGRFSAEQFGLTSLQFILRDGEWSTHGTGEDCLYLNIWTPTTAPAKPLPVMVWIHGGSFTAGSPATPSLGGANFARDGVVLVNLGYRVGALGFTHFGRLFPQLAGSGNLGLLDQMAALEWVQKNIHAFGGDPQRITLMGCSAGSMSVGALLSRRDISTGVRRAVMESGAPMQVLDADVAESYAEVFCRHAGVAARDLDALLALTPEAILTAFVATSQACASRESDAPAYGIVYGPVIDGRTLERSPLQAWRDGAAAHVDLLIGSMAEEWKLFSAFHLPAGIVPEHADAQLGKLAARRNGAASELRAAYRRDGEALSDAELIDRVETDRWYRMPSIRFAEAQVRHNPNVWMYQFAWRSSVPGLGACHGMEQPFVFDNFLAPEVPNITGPNPPQALADIVHGAWTAFGSNGVPQNAAMPHWPRYDLARRATMRLDLPCNVVDDPQRVERQAWDGIL
jgi:para-nitrobenzyl esterase